MQKELVSVAEQLGVALKEREWRLTTAESCTGGLISMALCATKDSAEFYSGGIVTYSNQAKRNLLGVKADTLATHTAVSKETVAEMALGALTASQEAVSVAVSGYAGPEGGGDGTPAGTVWFAWAILDDIIDTRALHFKGNSEQVIYQAAYFALHHLLILLKRLPPSNV
ncbi:TPA: nicotinamide-nucleotide amidohydrolase family protein [Serratia marcescens]|nr:nicotinamide-nucleotide amidohydrolase family protein [Serratia marcescens]